jgi:hypothetical protein
MHFDLKKKMERLTFFDPNAIFNQSEDSSFEDDEIHHKSLEISPEESKKNIDAYSSAIKKAQGKGNFVYKKINCYKLVIKWLDIISTFLIIVSMLIAQMDNQNFYEKNLIKRTTVIRIANYILRKNFSEYNAIQVDASLNCTNFWDTFDKNDISSLKVELVIDDHSQTLRFLILILTVISGKH